MPAVVLIAGDTKITAAVRRMLGTAKFKIIDVLSTFNPDLLERRGVTCAVFILPRTYKDAYPETIRGISEHHKQISVVAVAPVLVKKLHDCVMAAGATAFVNASTDTWESTFLEALPKRKQVAV